MTPLLLLATLFPAADERPKRDFSRWEKTIATMEKRDKDKPPPKNAVLFAGSSSIVRWDLSKSFPGIPAVNRGFGGSELADVTHFAPRILLPHQPRLLVLYAGDNDLGAGKTPEQVLADFKDFARTVHARRPKVPIVFISIKPSIARWRLADKIKKANALIEAECKKDQRLTFVDVWGPMLGKDGLPRKELFVKDGLHLSAEGYKLWADALKKYLK